MAGEVEKNGASALYREVDFGMAVEAFLESPIGKYLVKRAEEEVEDAVEKLKVVDCTATQEIRALQNQIYRAESIQYWLAEAIQAGQNASDELIDQRI